MKKLYFGITVALLLLITACSIAMFNMAVDGEYTRHCKDLPEDSVYTLMACWTDEHKGRHLPDARIEQWIKPVKPFVLKASDITISYKDSLDLEFQMQDVWGDHIDSIKITKPTLIAFVVKKVKGIHLPASLMYRLDMIPLDSTLVANPYVTLTEKINGSKDSMTFKFDFDKDDVALYDNRCDEIYLHYIDTGRWPKIYYERYFKGEHSDRYKSFSYDESVRKLMKEKRKAHKKAKKEARN